MESSSADKKNCPFCNAEINLNAKKCRFCGNWIDEEIECPFCAERIKASAKKCRFCGEFLPSKKNKINIFSSIEGIFSKKLGLVFLIVLPILFVLVLFIFSVLYVPTCESRTITDKLQSYLLAKNSEIKSIVLDTSSVNTISKQDRGYSCSIDAVVDDAPTHFEFSYKKQAMNDFNINAEPVLPNCFSPQVKLLLKDLVKDLETYDISEIADDITTKHEAVSDFDKETPSYNCEATVNITSKPGKAFVLNYWNIADAQREIECKVNYKTYFCNNGFTTCVSLKNNYSCSYKED